MSQIRCSQCGSYKVTDTHRKMGLSLGGCLVIPGFIIFILSLSFIGNGNLVGGLLWIGFFLLIDVIGFAIISPYKNQYSCDSCGYVWKQG